MDLSPICNTVQLINAFSSLGNRGCTSMFKLSKIATEIVKIEPFSLYPIFNYSCLKQCSPVFPKNMETEPFRTMAMMGYISEYIKRILIGTVYMFHSPKLRITMKFRLAVHTKRFSDEIISAVCRINVTLLYNTPKLNVT
jgi:hypothetical protein